MYFLCCGFEDVCFCVFTSFDSNAFNSVMSKTWGYISECDNIAAEHVTYWRRISWKPVE